MENTYLNYVNCFKQGDSNYFNYILEPIKPCILKRVYWLKYPEAQTDLIIHLLKLLKKIDLSGFDDDSDLQRYLKVCIVNKSNNLSKNRLKEKELISFNSDVLDIALNNEYCSSPINSDLCFFDLISKLNQRQQEIIRLKFSNNLTDIEIANKLKISRQAVHKQKTNALKTLKKELETTWKGGDVFCLVS